MGLHYNDITNTSIRYVWLRSLWSDRNVCYILTTPGFNARGFNVVYTWDCYGFAHK